MRLVLRSAFLVSVLIVAVVGLFGKAKNDTRQGAGAQAEEESALFIG